MTSHHTIFFYSSFYVQQRKNLRKARKKALEAEEKQEMEKKPDGLDQGLKFYHPDKIHLDLSDKKTDNSSVVQKKDSNCRTRL